MIYRVLKAIQNINQNIKKEDLMKVMSISRDNDKNHNFFIDLLTPDALKLKLGCLFNKYSKAKLYNWEQIKNKHHWITKCCTTSERRKKWNIKWNLILGKNLNDIINKSYILKSNQLKAASIINEATKEIVLKFREVRGF